MHVSSLLELRYELKLISCLLSSAKSSSVFMQTVHVYPLYRHKKTGLQSFRNMLHMEAKCVWEVEWRINSEHSFF